MAFKRSGQRRDDLAIQRPSFEHGGGEHLDGAGPALDKVDYVLGGADAPDADDGDINSRGDLADDRERQWFDHWAGDPSKSIRTPQRRRRDA